MRSRLLSTGLLLLGIATFSFTYTTATNLENRQKQNISSYTPYIESIKYPDVKGNGSPNTVLNIDYNGERSRYLIEMENGELTLRELE